MNSDCPPKRQSSKTTLSVRYRDANPNHHLWSNHGVWFIHYTIHCDQFMKQRIRYSLNTKSVAIARARRDAVLAGGDHAQPASTGALIPQLA